MNIIVFNCGSSSLKYRIIRMPDETELAGGEAQRIGPPTAEPARIIHREGGREHSHETPMKGHAEAFAEVMKLLGERLRPDAIGHRVVHGGAIFHDAAIMTNTSFKALEKLRNLAPIHNPPATDLIAACMARTPDTPQVALFDTAFHSSIPPRAYTYALPKELREGFGLRKYGFHGTSHRFVMEEACRLMGMEQSRFDGVSCHLGSGGASLCAIRGGESIDNTMGFSPLQGLMMSTRSGDLDPAVVLTLLQEHQGDIDAVERLLNRKSGLLGLTDYSGDIRDIIAEANRGDQAATRTVQAYLWRIRKYLGSYLALVGTPEAVIFTDTIGELEPAVRWSLCTDLELFGLRVDPTKNENATKLPVEITAPDSQVRVFVIATNEELAIARRTYWTLLTGGESKKGNAA